MIVPDRPPSILSMPNSTNGEQQKSTDGQDSTFAPKNHPKFHFADGYIVFLVQGVLYRVHRYFFLGHSSYFCNVLDNHPDEETPLPLDDIDCSEFEAFLSVLYPTNFHECDVKTTQDWSAVLRLSTMWSFGSIRALAIERLQSIASPVDKVVLGRACDVETWLVPGFIALCTRPQSLSVDEGNRLGMTDVIAVAAVRDTLRALEFVDSEARDEVLDMVKSQFTAPNRQVEGQPGDLKYSCGHEDSTGTGPYTNNLHTVIGSGFAKSGFEKASNTLSALASMLLAEGIAAKKKVDEELAAERKAETEAEEPLLATPAWGTSVQAPKKGQKSNQMWPGRVAGAY